MPSQREMQHAYLHSDATYDGVFFVAVRTTGVFCRPSCSARKPKPENVEFFATPHDALLGGYRPCKRCHPLEQAGRPPHWVEQLLAAVERAPEARLRDADLRAMAIDPARARRHFKRHYGMTFQAYQRARRLGAALKHIHQGAGLLDVAMQHGYDSNSGFREAFERTFGQPPGRCRHTECIVTQTVPSPLGPVILCATPRAVCMVEFTDRRALDAQIVALRRHFGLTVVPGTNEHLAQVKTELEEYFAGTRQAFTVPLDYPGTAFQHEVWDQLREIPYAQTISYAELARRVGRPKAQRAVGTANGQNRLGIVVPCHRVVNCNGQLGGYGGGLWRKQFLLDLETRVAAAPTSSRGKSASRT